MSNNRIQTAEPSAGQKSPLRDLRVGSQFFSFVKKEFLYIFRDTWTMIILLLLPVLMLILFGFGISTEIKNTRVAVYDPSRDMATRQIVNSLSASEYFIIDRYLSGITEAEQVLKRGDIGLVVVFSGNFNESMNRGGASVQLIADGSDPNTASTLASYATAIISATEFPAGDFGNPSAGTGGISCQIKLLYNPTLKGAYSTVPGIMGLVFMLICTMMTSISIAREKETGSMEVLLVSPVKPATIILAKTVPYFVLSLVDFAIVLLLSVFVLKVPVAGSLALLTALAMIFIFLCLSLGVLISIVAPSQVVAMLMSAVVMLLPTIFFSGLMFPIQNMPEVFQLIARIIPAKWFIEAARAVMIQGSGIAAIARQLLVLSGMAVFLLIVSTKKFNRRLS